MFGSRQARRAVCNGGFTMAGSQALLETMTRAWFSDLLVCFGRASWWGAKGRGDLRAREAGDSAAAGRAKPVLGSRAGADADAGAPDAAQSSGRVMDAGGTQGRVQ